MTRTERRSKHGVNQPVTDLGARRAEPSWPAGSRKQQRISSRQEDTDTHLQQLTCESPNSSRNTSSTEPKLLRRNIFLQELRQTFSMCGSNETRSFS